MFLSCISMFLSYHVSVTYNINLPAIEPQAREIKSVITEVPII